MRVALSGYAGVGKSTLINITQNDFKNYIVVPESAREVKKTEKYFIINNEKNKVFQKSIMDNEFVKINMILLNNIKNAIFDRSIIDNFAFAELAYGKENINYDLVQKHIDELRFKYNIKYIYDDIILIKISKDREFIKYLLQDSLRQETTSNNIDDFIKKGINWERRYIEILKNLKGITEKFDVIDHFKDNPNFESYFKNIIK